MGLISGIKKIVNTFKLNAKIKFILESYINSTSIALKDSIIIGAPSDEVNNVYLEISTDPNYNHIAKSFDELVLAIGKHNKEIASLDKLINSFNYADIIANPYGTDYNNLVSKFDKIHQKLLKYNIKTDKFKKFDGEYRDIRENYETIAKLYDIKCEIEKLEEEKPTKYLDYNERKKIINKAKKWDKYLSKNKYYDIEFDSDDYVDELNNEFIRMNVNDSIFNNVNGKSLDKEQKTAVLKDEIANLVIAGAGSGKTLTICGKVKYLIERCNVNKKDILLLSYSKKSADDLDKKIGMMYDDIEVSTFHSLGLKILTQVSGKKLAIEEQFKAIIEKYFREDMYKRDGAVEKVLTYLALYSCDYKNDKKYRDQGEMYEDLAKNEFKTLKDLKASSEAYNKRMTLKKELVKSYEELAIANFYFINGINYVYEGKFETPTATADKRQYTPDFYLPDYRLYHEHYGINRDGRCTQYDATAEAKYLAGIEWKRALHQYCQTNYIETYSYQFSENTLLDDLKAMLDRYGVRLNRLNNLEIRNTINSIYNDVSFKSFINLISTFVNLYKASYMDESEFDRMKRKNFRFEYNRKRAELFLDICKDLYCYYMDTLRKSGKIDFDDMILKSINALDQVDDFKYKYIIVDEFQDISNSRMRFVLKLLNHSKGKLFAVGDDYQAIYRFSGCDLNYFIGFDKYFNLTTKSFITSTHRNSQELQNIVVPFILKNPMQLEKRIKSEKHIINPIRVYYYTESRTAALLNVLSLIAMENSNAHIMLLGRNNADLRHYEGESLAIDRITGDIVAREYPGLKIRFSTVHGSKGLEEDYVVLLNADDGMYGFPNKMEDDPILDLVLSDESGISFSEERRLWYVALTRTRGITYIISNPNKKSIFLKEILDKCLECNPEEIERDENPIYCPYCKSGKLKFIDLNNRKPFFRCSNYPYCSYKNSDISSVNRGKRCPLCGDFMTVRRGRYGTFWGCHSYPACKHTEHISNDR